MKKIGTFLTITLVLSSICWWRVISAGSLGVDGGMWVLALMWSPGIAALVTRLIYQKNLRGEGWGWGGTRWQLLSYFLPLGYAAVAYSAVWAAGLGGIGTFEGSLLTFVVMGTIQGCFSALGEELGWRGFLVPELAKHHNFTRTAVISGVIWAFWHSPLIIFADYNAGTATWYSLLCFVVMVMGISFAFAWLRLRSGSVWTGMFMHASHNLWIQGFFDRVTVNTGKTLWYTTEFGAALAVVGVIVAYVFWRRRDLLGPLPAAAP